MTKWSSVTLSNKEFPFRESSPPELAFILNKVTMVLDDLHIIITQPKQGTYSYSQIQKKVFCLFIL